MNRNMKLYVISLLETYSKREQQIDLLHYEMRHTARVSSGEIIDGMSLGHGDGMGGSKGHISNKTMYIALNYQEKMEHMNEESANEIAECLLKLETEQNRLRHYVSLWKSGRRRCFGRFTLRDAPGKKPQRGSALF